MCVCIRVDYTGKCVSILVTMVFFGAKKVSKVDTDPQKIEELLTRGVENIFPNKDFLKKKLSEGIQMTFYYGIDPTGPTIHVGHLISIRKLAQLQKLGHKIIFLIGDFTAMIGDPTDKVATRKKLSRKEVLLNCKNYQKQIAHIISFSGSNKALVKYNSEWLSKMSFQDVVELASHFTVQQILERDMFEKRIEEGKPVYMHEFLYPLMQGYDSVAMGVDGELGGNDQTFNMLAGRDLMKTLQGKEKFVLVSKLLVDPTGKKMGKSEGNMVALDQTPEDMFGKVMSWSDGMIVPAYEIVTDIPMSEIETIKKNIEAGANPRDAKVGLAQEIVAMCFDVDAAEKAKNNFEKTFSKGEIPENIQQVVVAHGEVLGDVLVTNKIIDSKTEFKRLVDEGAIMNMETSKKVTEWSALVEKGTYKIGKKRFVRVVTSH